MSSSEDERVVLNDLKVLSALICLGSLTVGIGIPGITSYADLKILLLVKLPADKTEAKQGTKFRSLTLFPRMTKGRGHIKDQDNKSDQLSKQRVRCKHFRYEPRIPGGGKEMDCKARLQS